MFAWCPIPEPFTAMGSVEFTKLLIEKADLAVSPGLGFGEYGEGYVRIALVENEQRIRASRTLDQETIRGCGSGCENCLPNGRSPAAKACARKIK